MVSGKDLSTSYPAKTNSILPGVAVLMRIRKALAVLRKFMMLTGGILLPSIICEVLSVHSIVLMAILNCTCDKT